MGAFIDHGENVYTFALLIFRYSLFKRIQSSLDSAKILTSKEIFAGKGEILHNADKRNLQSPSTVY